jgi:cytolysin-activating lysine-acyltransferase
METTAHSSAATGTKGASGNRPPKEASASGSQMAAANPVVRPRDAGQARFAQSFTQVIAVLMRDPELKSLKVSDLEWLVLPPLMAGQYKLGHAARQADPSKPAEPRVTLPIAVALWAMVSPAIDQSLMENLHHPARLRPGQWSSGEHIWLMATGGDPRAVPQFLKRLQETEFAGQTVKMRLRGPDGNFVVRELSQVI